MERLARRYHKPKPSILIPEFSSKPDLGLSTTLPARRLDSGAVSEGGTTTSAMTITPASGGASPSAAWLPSLSIVHLPGTGPHLSSLDPPNSRDVTPSSRRTIAAVVVGVGGCN